MSELVPTPTEALFTPDGDADELVSLLLAAPTPPVPTLVGVSGRGWETHLHREPVPMDHRCDAAGLFLRTVPEEWHTVGLLAPATARRLDETDEPEEQVVVVVAADREGGLASVLRTEDGRPLVEPDAPEGLIPDALLRSLGLPTRGPVPDPVDYSIALWLDAVTEVAVSGRPLPRERMLELRPEPFDSWAELHRRAAAGRIPLPDLDPAEAGWMDTPMFARWMRGALPATAEMLATLGLLLTRPEQQSLVGVLRADLGR